MERVIEVLHHWIWGPPLLIFLVGTHLYMSFRTGFIQKKILLGVRLSFCGERAGKGETSSFRALMTSLASTIGTGNIIGVGTAIALGGPGAVFWMWICGVLGIATKYGESLMALWYQVRGTDGNLSGGAMYVLRDGLKCPWGGVLFAAFTALAALGIGSLVQSNSIAALGASSLHLPPVFTGGVACLLVGLVLMGGIRSISRVCGILIPAAAIFFLVGNLLVLWINGEFLDDAISLILRSAFVPQAAGGGFAGATLRSAMEYGISRGLFSNESGMGSAPIAASAARGKNPVRQALIAATGTFWDTVVLCALTGLAIVSSSLADPTLFAEGMEDGAFLTTRAFSCLGPFGPVFLAVSLTVFAFSTMIGWYYYGERAVDFLLGYRALKGYRLLYVAAVFGGAWISLDLAWGLCDIFNGLMAVPNLVALWFFAGRIAAETAVGITPARRGKSLRKMENMI